jgi:hypothetical protein
MKKRHAAGSGGEHKCEHGNHKIPSAPDGANGKAVAELKI